MQSLGLAEENMPQIKNEPLTGLVALHLLAKDLVAMTQGEECPKHLLLDC